MAHAFYHAKSSARKFGGTLEDYLDLHTFMDSTKAHVPDNRHRLFLHNAWGIFFVEEIFGTTITRQSDGKQVPTRTILEQHVKEDFGGKIPTLEQCFDPSMKTYFSPLDDNEWSHCIHSAKTFGGEPIDYMVLHKHINQVRNVYPHDAGQTLLHNAWGISLLVVALGETFVRPSDRKVCSIRAVLEAHVQKDRGCIPTMAQSIEHIQVARWMSQDALPLSQMVEHAESPSTTEK